MKESNSVEYTFFNKFILRSPLKPVQFFLKIKTKTDIKHFCENSLVKQAIFLASPTLFNEMGKWLKGSLNPEEEDRVAMSLYKYFSRMASRSTPFGLFAGCSIGEIGYRTHIQFDSQRNQLYNQLDMNYVCLLAQYLTSLPFIRNKLRYYPNSSIYNIGGQVRLITYKYLTDDKRKYSIKAVENSSHLKKVLKKAQKGEYINELINVLVDDKITQEEAEIFLDEIIKNQLLISELEPSLTGIDFFTRLYAFVEKIDKYSEVTIGIGKIKKYLQTLNNGIDVSNITYYHKIGKILSNFKIKFEQKYLIQADLYKPLVKSSIGVDIVEDVRCGIDFLIKLSSTDNENLNLKEFKEKFSKRYDQQEVSLLIALDNETGIGYGKNNNYSAGESPLVDGIEYSSGKSNSSKIYWDKKQSFLYKLYERSLKEKLYEVTVQENDIKDLHSNASTKEFPPTFSCLVKVLKKDKNNHLLSFDFAGGSSAANLLSRFTNIGSEIHEYVKCIYKKEQALSKNNEIFADVIHLPEYRVGNVLARSVLRNFEIPFLAHSTLAPNKQINLNDLFLSVRENKIFLRSKVAGKEVIPQLSTAHNFSNNSLPVYHFLGDMQTGNNRAGVGFSWGFLEDNSEFLPRLKYRNIIFSPARWNINNSNSSEILNNNIVQNIQFTQWRIKLKIPQYITLNEGDNKLLLDLENELSMNLFVTILKKRKVCRIEEFLFDIDNPLLKTTEGTFMNEIILSFYKTN